MNKIMDAITGWPITDEIDKSEGHITVISEKAIAIVDQRIITENELRSLEEDDFFLALQDRCVKCYYCEQTSINPGSACPNCNGLLNDGWLLCGIMAGVKCLVKIDPL